MSSFRFCFRASSRKGEHPGHVYLRVVHAGASRSVTTDYKVLPSEWDDVAGAIRAVGSAERQKQLAEYSAAMVQDAARMAGVIGALERRGDFSIDHLMATYRKSADRDNANTLNAYAEKLAAVMEQSGYERTARAYRSAAAKIAQFHGGDLQLEQLNAALVGEFEEALTADGKSPNTISFYMRTLRAIYNKAIDDGRVAWQRDKPFSEAHTAPSQAAKPTPLTDDELARLSEFNPATGKIARELPDHLKPALAKFLFSHHSQGMNFVDMAFLKKRDVQTGVIRYRRRRTGRPVEVAISPAMRQIMDWFEPQVAGSEYLFPVITDPEGSPRLQYESGLRRYNDRLKNIAQLLGIEKPLSTTAAPPPPARGS